MLSEEQFLSVVAATPLVSIDFVIRNEAGEVLLGKRVNRPAQGLWFVPGGRIRKDERIADAFLRIAKRELGLSIERSQATLLGAFDHIYPDNALGADGISTHYVVLAHALALPAETRFAPDEQHSEMRWWSVEKMLRSDAVHENTKAYFR